MTLSVVGAGFGRTGTASMKEALELLGFGPCYHMYEAMKHPDHGPLWHAGLRGDSMEWDALLAGYKACVDWPASYFWLDLMYEYPDSKVVLTVRDPEKWYTSMTQTILAHLQTDSRSLDPVDQMAYELITKYVFPEGTEDKDYLIKVFEQNTHNVCQTVPQGRLLVFDVAEGWQPLCDFLEVPVPDQPFPRVNDTAAFIDWANQSAET